MTGDEVTGDEMTGEEVTGDEMTGDEMTGNRLVACLLTIYMLTEHISCCEVDLNNVGCGDRQGGRHRRLETDAVGEMVWHGDSQATDE
nr:hypothetical protein BgiMline_013600 [Biomphalaria glabrata]